MIQLVDLKVFLLVIQLVDLKVFLLVLLLEFRLVLEYHHQEFEIDNVAGYLSYLVYPRQDQQTLYLLLGTNA